MRLAADILTAALAFAGAASGFTGQASAQTIADYSQAQRAVIQAEIARNTAKAMAVSAASSATPPAAAAVPGPAPGGVPAAETGVSGRPGPALSASGGEAPAGPSDPPSWRVSGVFLSSTRALAEIVVDGVAHWVGAGQAVPGTPWRVQSVAAQQVVLVPAQARHVGRRPVQAKVLKLPAVAP